VVMIKRRLATILHRTEGSLAIEYAIVLPLLLWFIAFILEYSIVMYTTAMMENATNEAVAKGAGFQGSGQSQATYIDSLIKGQLNASGTFNTTDSSIYLLETPMAIDGSGNLSTALFQQTGSNITYQPVIYTATYKWKIVTPFLKYILSSPSGVYTIATSATIMNLTSWTP